MRWTQPEIERVVSALNRLPETFWMEEIEGVYRFKKSKDEGNPASSVKGIIGLYDSAFSEKIELARILSHELAHEKYRRMHSSSKLDYMRTSGWKPVPLNKGTYGVTPPKSGFVGPDGDTSPEEDFANNVEEYLFDESRLKSIAPKARN